MSRSTNNANTILTDFTTSFKKIFSTPREELPNEWKDLVLNESFSIDEVVNMRDLFVSSAHLIACEGGLYCKETGSIGSPLSDKDIVLIPQKEHADSHQTLIRIKSYLDDAKIGTLLQKMPAEKIMELLDVNIYTTSFEIYICVGQHLLSIIRNGQAYYVSSKENCIQRKLAYRPLLSFANDSKIPKLIQDQMKECETTLDNLSGMCKRNANDQLDCSALQYCYNDIISDLTAKYKGTVGCDADTKNTFDQQKLDNVVNIISFMSTRQREAYVTQGAFLRWVLLENQTEQEHSEITTAINVLCTRAGHVCKDNITEHLCLAYKENNELSRLKYLSRAYNATLELYNKEAGTLWSAFSNSQLVRIRDFLISKISIQQNQQSNADDKISKLMEYANELDIEVNKIKGAIMGVLTKLSQDTQYNYTHVCVRPMPVCTYEGGASTKVRKQVKLLGRTRNVYKYGRQSYVRVKGSLILLREARELDKEQAKKNKTRTLPQKDQKAQKVKKR
jgi:hypothetical protein